jgi:tight adherence protein B
MLPLVALAVFAVTFAVVVGVLLAGKRKEAAPAAGADGSVREQSRDDDDSEPFDWLMPVRANALLKEESLSTISLFDRILARVDGAERMKARVAEAGLNWSVGRLTAMMLLSAAATFAILWKMSWVPTLAAFAISCAAGAGPYLIVLRRRSRRLNSIEEHFPDALDSLARSLRAGNALAAAFEILAREAPQPLGGEIRRTLNERNLGGNWDAALDRLAVRVPLPEMNVFVAALQLQSRTGGKLHEVLAKLAETMRESGALKGEIRSIAAHGRLTGLILTLLPIAIAGIMAYVNPPQMYLLWTHPTGNILIWAAGGCLLLAHIVIGKMVDIRI